MSEGRGDCSDSQFWRTRIYYGREGVVAGVYGNLIMKQRVWNHGQGVDVKGPLLVSPPPPGSTAGASEALGPAVLSEAISSIDLRTPH